MGTQPHVKQVKPDIEHRQTKGLNTMKNIIRENRNRCGQAKQEYRKQNQTKTKSVNQHLLFSLQEGPTYNICHLCSLSARLQHGLLPHRLCLHSSSQGCRPSALPHGSSIPQHRPGFSSMLISGPPPGPSCSGLLLGLSHCPLNEPPPAQLYLYAPSRREGKLSQF